MNTHLWWYIARSTGIVASALLTASVLWGLLLSTRLLSTPLRPGRPTPRWLTDLHRFLAALATVFTVLHLGGLVADSTTHFGPAELLVPLASAYRPLPVALGVVALYLFVAVEVSSLLMKRLPRTWWRRIHLGSFGAFWLATVHGITAGTDRTNPVLFTAYVAAAGLVVFLTSYRILLPRGAGAGPHQAVPETARGGSSVHSSS